MNKQIFVWHLKPSNNKWNQTYDQGYFENSVDQSQIYCWPNLANVKSAVWIGPKWN